MKLYEKIIKYLENETAKNPALADELLIYPNVWIDFKNDNLKRINNILSTLNSKGYRNYSEEYWYYLSNYHCPFLGAIDMFLTIDNVEGDENTILYNINELKNYIPNAELLPIACVSSDYVYLDKKGRIIQWTGMAKQGIPKDFSTEISLEEYEAGCNVAYMPLPDINGNYLMYMILSLSFDDFMNEYVFGDKYPELVGKKDTFYYYVKNIRNTNGISILQNHTATTFGGSK